MKRKIRKYDKEFKERAVDLYFSGDQSYTEVAEDLGIPTSTLAFWCKQTEKHPDDPFPGKGKLRPEDAKQKDIFKENRRLRRERDILKKALAIFSKGPKTNISS